MQLHFDIRLTPCDQEMRSQHHEKAQKGWYMCMLHGTKRMLERLGCGRYSVQHRVQAEGCSFDVQ